MSASDLDKKNLIRDTHKTSNYIFSCSSWKFIGADRISHLFSSPALACANSDIGMKGTEMLVAHLIPLARMVDAFLIPVAAQEAQKVTVEIFLMSLVQGALGVITSQIR